MDQIARMLRNRYIFALTLIAILVIATNYGTESFINKQIHDSRIINLAGKQRMLSQKITKIVYQLPHVATETDEHLLLTELTTSLDLWEATHKGLQYGDEALKLPGNNPPEIQNLYNGIQDEHETMLTAARQIITITASDKDSEAVIAPLRTVLSKNEAVFLKGMDAIAFKYDDLARIKVEKILSIEKTLLFVTLFSLLLEALFIFKPAVQLINRTIKGLQINEKNLQDLFDTAPTMNLLITESNKQILRVNTIAQEMLELSLSESKKYHLYDFIEAKYLEPLDAFIANKQLTQMQPTEIVLRNVNNDSAPMIMLASKLYYSGEDIVLINFSDITEQKKNEALLKNLASTDEMTGMLNRRTGLIIFEKTLESAKRKHGRFTTCFVDLDGLKYVNDTYGHPSGDTFIKTLAKAMQKNIRADDIAFRYGGDEFVIIFSDCNEQEAVAIINRIKHDCQSFKQMMSLPYNIDFSYGCTAWDKVPNMTIAELIEIADDKMYQDKVAKYPGRIKD